MSEAAIQADIFGGEIRVAARVIDFLSSGLYKNAAACMKELINNSYDADATLVQVSVKPDADLIAIEDNGAGMTRDKFEKHFQRVAESHKRDDGQNTERLQRAKIGKIGIGFIAANELCDEMEIYSTEEGSRQLLHVVIKFGEIRERAYLDRLETTGDVHKGDYHGEVRNDADEDEHFTKVYLKQIRPTALDSFISTRDELGKPTSNSFYGRKPENVASMLRTLETWDELDLYSQTRARIGLNVPVPYHDHWAPSSARPQLSPFTQRAKRANFRVVYDGTDLLKPIVLNERRDRSLVRRLSFKSKLIKAQGYLYASHGALRPRELNGVLIRIRESAVGEYDGNFLGFPQQISSLFQDWVSGEIYVDGELDDALNIDRQTLRDTHPAYVELKAWFLGELREFFSEVRAELYAKPNADRQARKAEQATQSFEGIANRVRETYGPAAAKSLRQAWTDPPSSRTPGKPRSSEFLKTYTVNEIYEIALDVANEVLPNELAVRYIAELTRRLRG